MARRKSVSDAPETGLPVVMERSPLLDRRLLRSSSFALEQSTSKLTQGYKPAGRTRSARYHSSKAGAQPLMKTISERRAVSSGPSLQRTRSAPLSSWYSPSPQSVPSFRSSPAFRSSPQYRVNPVVRFDERFLLPERMNYGIAGYNTSRPRGLSGVGEKRGLVRKRPRTLKGWRVLTRRFRERMTRIRVKRVCSRLLMRFRGRH